MDAADLVVWLLTLPLAAALVLDGIAESSPGAVGAGLVLLLVVGIPQVWLDLRDRIDRD